jgi:hypothetical protein
VGKVSKDWKGHQAAVAKAFRMVTTGIRVAPPDCPDSVDVEVVRQRLDLHRFDDGRKSSAFLPEAKSGYKPSKFWLSVQKDLKHASSSLTTPFPYLIVTDVFDSMFVTIMLMNKLSVVLSNLEVNSIGTVLFNLGYEIATIPKIPVRGGFEQLDRYISKPLYRGKYPVVVWHFDHKRFDDDLCFFKLDDLRKVGKNLLKINYFD